MLETEITEANISKLVEKFYAKVRISRELGEIFNNAVEDWAEHTAKIVLFWKDMMLGTREFQGRPGRTHIMLPPFDLALFDEWLRLFHETADEIYTPITSALYKEKSSAIASNFKRMIEIKRQSE